MSKPRRVKLEALLIFLAVFLYALYSGPDLVKWQYLSDPNSAAFDMGLSELIGALIPPAIVAWIWYAVRKPKAIKPGPPQANP